MKTKNLIRMKELQENNWEKYKIVINDFVRVIKKQGSGCNVPGYGAAYYSEVDKTLDPIGLVLGFQAIRTYYGVISEEAQSHLVQLLARRYRVNTETDKAHSEFVTFLQECQDIHDFSFDEYYEVDGNRLEKYLVEMTELKEKYSLN